MKCLIISVTNPVGHTSRQPSVFGEAGPRGHVLSEESVVGVARLHHCCPISLISELTRVRFRSAEDCMPS